MSNKTVKSFDELGDVLEDYVPDVVSFERMIDDIGLKHGKELVQNIKHNPPYRNQSSKLNSANDVEGSRGFLTFFNDAKSKNGFPYAIALHNGSGIYGPNHKPITAKNGGYLTFKIGDKWIKCKSVKGVKPMKWFNKEWTKESNLKKLAKEMFKASEKLFEVK